MKTQSQTILIIEDDQDAQQLLERYLSPKGYKIIFYEDASKALADLENHVFECDLAISDLLLPNISGIEFTRQVKEKGLDFPIIVLTATRTVETAMEAINAGAYDFVVKPVHFPQLLLSIERALHLVRIKSENLLLRSAMKMKESPGIEGIIGKSPKFLKTLDLARRVAASDSVLYIYGESGTGKEVIAKAIHNLGPRQKLPLVAINCSSIPEGLLESELFGHAKGAFTGASENKKGLFEEANGGTLFLDEIGELSLTLQAKLLRVIQDRKIKRVGENNFRPIDVRIISATHKDLKKEVAENRFREDLYFRLNVIQIKMPPLRERKEDIIPLAEFFFQKFASLNKKSQIKGFSKNALEKILTYRWPGNIRELENSVERAVILASTDYLLVEDLFDDETLGSEMPEFETGPSGLPAYNAPHAESGSEGESFELSKDSTYTIDEVVNQYIRFVLKKNNGVKEKTARELNIDRKTLYRRIDFMGLTN